MEIIDKVALVYIRDNKLLMTLSKGREKYYLPGGKREKGETDKETLIREIKEELSADIVEDTIKYYGTLEAQADSKAKGVIVKCKYYMADISTEPTANSEIASLHWVKYLDMDKMSALGQLLVRDLYSKGLMY